MARKFKRHWRVIPECAVLEPDASQRLVHETSEQGVALADWYCLGKHRDSHSHATRLARKFEPTPSVCGEDRFLHEYHVEIARCAHQQMLGALEHKIPAQM